MTFPRTGGMVLCETIGKHPDIKVLNEDVNWKEKIKYGNNFVIKPFWWNIHNEDLNANIFKDFPTAKFIFLTRNPLDIAASYKTIDRKLRKKGLTARDYLTEPKLKEEPIWITAVKQYKNKLTWLEQHKNNPDLLIISFEDMILKKHETFEKVFEHIGFSYCDEVREVVEKEISNGILPKRVGIAMAMFKEKRIGNYREVLTRWEIKKINAIFPRSGRVS